MRVFTFDPLSLRQSSAGKEILDLESTPGCRLTHMNAASYDKPLSWLTVFASACTLICCALPIARVTFGLEIVRD